MIYIHHICPKLKETYKKSITYKLQTNKYLEIQFDITAGSNTYKNKKQLQCEASQNFLTQ